MRIFFTSYAFNFLQKPHVWKNFGSWIMIQKPLDQLGFFKLEYLRNELNYEVEVLYVINTYRNNKFS